MTARQRTTPDFARHHAPVTISPLDLSHRPCHTPGMKTHIAFITTLLLSQFSLAAMPLRPLAFVPPPVTELTYACQVVLAGTNLPPDRGVWKFEAPESSGGSHGGETRVFTEGIYEITVLANAQWLGISWSQSGKKIAEGVFVLGSNDRTLSRVALLYDPSDSGAQVSLDCTEGKL